MDAGIWMPEGARVRSAARGKIQRTRRDRLSNLSIGFIHVSELDDARVEKPGEAFPLKAIQNEKPGSAGQLHF